MANVPLTTFNGGETTPKTSERVDTEKYQSGCRTLENLIPTIYGGVERRPGTIFISICEVPAGLGA